jgi:hypothetical protein
MTPHRDICHQRCILSPMSTPDVGSDRQADTQILLTPRSRLVTAGDRSFQVAGPRIWNSLPSTVTRSTVAAVIQTAAENFFTITIASYNLSCDHIDRWLHVTLEYGQ